MKIFTLVLLVIVAASSAFSQPNFGNYYTATLGANTNARPIVVKCYDGSIIGISNPLTGQLNSFSLFRIGIDGNMLWLKNISFGSTSTTIPHNIAMLSDSTLAILIEPMTSGVFYIIKCDLSGNVLWVNNYSAPWTSTFFTSIVPYSNGGMMYSCYSALIFINDTGGVDKAFHFQGIDIWDSAPKDSGRFTLWGSVFSQSPDLFLFDFDTAGIIINGNTYLIPGDTMGSYNLVPYYLISKSRSGGVYGTFPLKGNPPPGFVVFYFDSLNQPLWARKVELLPSLQPRSVNTGINNECIAVATYYSSGLNFYPMVFKFDSTGVHEWTKTLGDNGIPAYNYRDVLTMIPDSGSGWYSTLSRSNIHVFHTDSALNGFCAYQNFPPVISNVSVTSAIFQPSFSLQAVSISPLSVTETPHGFYRYDACTGLLIDSVTAQNEIIPIKGQLVIYPNPATDNVIIEFPISVRNGTINVFNSTGEKIIEANVQNEDWMEIDFSNLPSGIYFIHLNESNQYFTNKIIVKHD